MRLNYKKYLFLFSAVAVMGFGCSANDSPVSLDKYKMPDAQPPAQSVPSETETTMAPPAESIPAATSTPAMPEAEVPAATSTTNEESNLKPSTKSEDMTNEPETLAFPGVLPEERTANKQIRIKTAKGDIVFELLPKEGPNAASNFVYLTERKYYDGLTFHRVEPGFVIQGGDPYGNGTGGPGYKFADDKVSLPYDQGIVAMANAGPNTNGSQFFIMLESKPLPPSYSIFGRVISGMEVVKQIAIGDVMSTVTIEPLKK
ncbi:MAG: peptidylprolyl isomerase [Patescibacteria group bacterium]